MNSDLDQGIDKNLDAAFIRAGLNKDVKYNVKNGVVTLTGRVNSQTKKTRAESVASKVPNVQQVRNKTGSQKSKGHLDKLVQALWDPCAGHLTTGTREGG